MNAEDKANKLIKDFTDYFMHPNEERCDYYAIQNSLICVAQIRNFMTENLKWDAKHNGNLIYWEEVQEELIKKKTNYLIKIN